MTSRRVIYSPEAETQLDALHSYIAAAASPDVATNYVGRIAEKCNSLADFANRGSPRDDFRDGLRTIPFRRRVTIIYAVEETEVVIIGIFYAGQDFEALLREE